MDASKILIVDDEIVNTILLKKIIKDIGYETRIVHSGKEALDILDTEEFDCILLDILMPGLSGFDVIKKIKKKPEYSDVPVIFLTGQEEPESIAQGFKLGAVDYVTKPFHGVEIQARIQSHIKLYKTIQSLAQAQLETLQQIQKVQDSMLVVPSDFTNPHFDVYFKSLHAAGGDIYEVLELENGSVGYFVGDFAGHSISTGFLTSSIKALLRQNCKGIYTPAESMRLVNSVLCNLMPSGMYLTAVYVVISKDQRITVVSMGHPPIIIMSQHHSKPQPLRMSGDVLGVFEEALFKSYTFSALAGDRLLLYTDGLIEGDEMWSSMITPFLAVIQEINEPSRELFLQELFQQTAALRGEVNDDILMLVVDVPGSKQELQVGEVDNQCSIDFPATIHLVEPAVEHAFSYIKNNLLDLHISDQYGIRLVIHEACANAIQHGNKYDQEHKSVAVRIKVDGEVLEIRVKDEGDGFDWQHYVAQSMHSGSHDSGRGIQLFIKYGFEVLYENGGRELVLTRRFS